MGTAAISNAKRQSQTIYLTGSITPQNEQTQPGNSMNYVPGVESTTYNGVYAVPWTTPTSFWVFQVIECRSTSAVFGVYGANYGVIADSAFPDPVPNGTGSGNAESAITP